MEAHPEDALVNGAHDADLAEPSTAQGTATVRVLITTKAQPGAVIVPLHWTARTAKAGHASLLVGTVTDPVSGQPTGKDTLPRRAY